MTANIDLPGLVAWTHWHALIVVLGVMLIVGGMPHVVFAGMAALSFLNLVHRHRHRWTAQGIFGLANWITLARLTGILVMLSLPGLNPESVIAVSITVFMLDGLDGYVARKMDLQSEFGEYFDKEADAFFMLALTILLYSSERFGVWIVVPGLLRYLFVLFMKIARPPKLKEQRTRTGRWVFFFMVSALIFCFTPFASLYIPAVGIMTMILTLSFAAAIHRLYA